MIPTDHLQYLWLMAPRLELHEYISALAGPELMQCKSLELRGNIAINPLPKVTRVYVATA